MMDKHSTLAATGVVTDNHAPIVTASNRTLVAGTTVHASDLISASDPDGNPITVFAVFDGNRDAGSGFWSLHGHALDAGQVQILSAAEFAQLDFHVGTAGTVDQLTIQVGDGDLRSARVPFTITSEAPVNHAPVVTGTNTTLAHGNFVDAKQFVKVTDADGDAITKYVFTDANQAATSGHWVVNGVVQTAASFEVAGADFEKVQWQGGSTTNGSVDQVTVQAFDAGAASNVATITMTTPANQAPVVTGHDGIFAPGAVITMNQLVSVADAEGDQITFWNVSDNNADAASGFFRFHGQTYQGTHFQQFTAAQFAEVEFVVGANGSLDALEFQAFDGLDQSNHGVAHVTSSITPLHADALFH